MPRQIRFFFVKFWYLSFLEKRLFLEALSMLYLAKMVVLILPFRICLKTIGKRNHQNVTSDEFLYSVKYAIGRASRLAFWKNVCLVQSFAARWMLQSRGISSTFFIGVAHDDKSKIIAHAWVKSGDIEIVPGGDQYTPLASY